MIIQSHGWLIFIGTPTDEYKLQINIKVQRFSILPTLLQNIICGYQLSITLIHYHILLSAFHTGLLISSL